MLSLITPENLPGILTAIGGLLGGGGILTWWKVRREPPKPGTPDATALALAENTKATLAMVEALKAQNAQFGDNNKLFGQVLHHVDGMAKDFTEARQHLAAIREQGNRR